MTDPVEWRGTSYAVGEDGLVVEGSAGAVMKDATAARYVATDGLNRLWILTDREALLFERAGAPTKRWSLDETGFHSSRVAGEAISARDAVGGEGLHEGGAVDAFL